jgi:hypothetical protein
MTCKRHFEDRSGTWDERRLAQAACPDCIAEREANAARIQRDHTIDPEQPYGRHITLTCRNHPHLRWSTKNIDFIGARSIFYFGTEPECSCSHTDLIPVKEA